MKLLIRLDASPKVGMGHLVRSLSIADKLSKVNPAITVNFIIRNDTLAVSAINEFNFRTYIYNGTEEEILSKAVKDHNPDLLFIDKIHEYSKNFILSLRIFTKVVMFHNICDGGYYADAFILPAAHVPDKIIDDIRWLHTSFYRGFNYIVLNDKIKELPKKSFLLDQNKLKFVITTGGSDPNGVMLKIIEWVNNPDFCNYEFCFLVGGAFMHRDKLNKISKEINTNICIKDYNVNEYIDSDIAISTFGVSTYELLYLGIPVISVGHCKKNALGSETLEKKYSAIYDFGLIDDLYYNYFVKKIQNILKNEKDLKKKSDLSQKLVDGKGIDRVVDVLYDLISNHRKSS